MDRPMIERLARHGAIVTGGPVADSFDAGWGKHPFVGGSRAHYWTADRRIELDEGAYGLVSACCIKTVATSQVPLLAAGTYEYCSKCERKLMRAFALNSRQPSPSPTTD